MKIPGLDSAMDRLAVVEEQLIPLLERIADGVDRLVELEEERQNVERDAT